jgi:RNA ligase (TIGR02306 family)
MHKNIAERAMAWIAKIDQVEKHPDADSLDICTVGGWKCVTKLGEFKQGDLAIYLEIDSWVPFELAPFLCKGREPREYNGVKGERLRTAKLRGQVSQGLLLPCSATWIVSNIGAHKDSLLDDFVGVDVSSILNIQKYEPPIPAQLAGEIRGLFPSFIRKTNQERVQNLTKELADWNTLEVVWEVTEKLDGSSMTVYVNEEDEGVCSRNLNMRQDENNSFWKTAIKENLIEKIRTIGRDLAFQGELIGEGIQKNRYGIQGQKFVLFDIFDIKTESYLDWAERAGIAEKLGITQVPVVDFIYMKGQTAESLLAMAEGKSKLNDKIEREGLVFKNSLDPDVSFKAISNKFLLKTGE